jgi:hypothetical protein
MVININPEIGKTARPKSENDIAHGAVLLQFSQNQYPTFGI